MKNPVYSVIIPALNEEEYLPQLLESLCRQTKKNFEVIVVDGKSKDSTVSVALSYKETLNQLQVVKSTVRSLPFQRNLGASISKGEWLVFVDADSIFLPYAFEQMDEFIRTQSPDLLTSWMKPDSNDVGDAFIILFWSLVLEGLVRIKRQLTPGPFTVVRKSVFDAVGGYDVTHHFNEDADFGLRMFKHTVTLHILRETLYVVSLRRLRAQGRLKVAQQYVQASLPILFLNKALSNMPGYIMGGQLYTRKKKSIGRSVFRDFHKQFKKLTSDLFQ